MIHGKTEEKLMTITERVNELDRLYLAHDAASKEYVAAVGTPRQYLCRRKCRHAWAAYIELRDSRRGLPVSPPRRD